ncbi:MAG: NAD-dependent epimerase/dehydratase family protein [Bacteroidetes bacterium]|nr:NAD-dependent epimerase/dehydratase family protein [Bacteroidota bacterium]
MIIGTGLLAKNVIPADSDNLLLFCSGVSDSTISDSQAFSREENLLLQQPRDKNFIYFSTISIFNPTKANNAYILHKIHMEELVRAHFPSHIIVRLPNIVGEAGNKSNLFPYFIRHIQQNIPVVIYKNAVRHILAAKDISHIVNVLTSASFQGDINVCFSNPPTVLDIYLYMCSKLHATPNYSLSDEEINYPVKNDSFVQLMGSNHPVIQNWKEIIDAYLEITD